MKRLFHPPVRRLQRWLDGAEPKLDKHLGTCEVCAARIEALDEPSAPLREALLEHLAPPELLDDRLRVTIDQRMQAREDLTLITELFGLPIRTVRLISSTSPEGET